MTDGAGQCRALRHGWLSLRMKVALHLHEFSAPSVAAHIEVMRPSLFV